jgi:hypothetical protein
MIYASIDAHTDRGLSPLRRIFCILIHWPINSEILLHISSSRANGSQAAKVRS